MVVWLEPNDPFPPLEAARRRPNGLLAAGKDLSVRTLLDAYGRGIFPWFSEGEPILWWSPDPRMVLYPRELHVSRSLARRLKRGGFVVTADTAFADVVRGCALAREDQAGTWITRGMAAAYLRLHAAGFAHSFETWMDGELAGGLYGVALGRAFFGESMFTRRTDASKIALVHLVRHLERHRFGLIDCQMQTAHLASFGAREISRRQFAAELRALVAADVAPGAWRLDAAPGPHV
jgi:leucyl/phenylalanyl-tRNA---protein transferase